MHHDHTTLGDIYSIKTSDRGHLTTWNSLAFTLLSALITTSVIAYWTAYRFDLVVLSPVDLFWNWLVVLTPTGLLNFLDNTISNSKSPQTHAAKSEKMRRLLGLDSPGGVITAVAQASRRRLSSLPGLTLNSGSDSRPAGLGNWDNSCYQNSVLQGLASLDTLAEYLKHPGTSADETVVVNTGMKMADSLRGLIATLNDPLNNGKRIWTPATLKNMSSWTQQDAQEYFSRILDEIDKEIHEAEKSSRPIRGLEIEERSQTTSALHKVGISSMRNPLEGLLAQRVGCTRCGFTEGLSMVPFNCLTVPLGRSWTYDIKDCLDEFTILEHIAGVECGKCTLLKSQRLLNIVLETTAQNTDSDKLHATTTARLQAVSEALEKDDYEEKTLIQKCGIPKANHIQVTKSRQAVVARPPKSLVVHVNRSMFDELTGEVRKNGAVVEFPKVLDLAPWCLGSSGTDDESNHCEQWLLDPTQSMVSRTRHEPTVRGPMYELRAVVTHQGRHENGHYVCYRKHAIDTPVEHGIEGDSDEDEDSDKTSQWWRFSDDDVTQASESTVRNLGGVFMLFYDCIEPATPSNSETPTLHSQAPHVVDSTFEDAMEARLPVLMDDTDDSTVYDDGGSTASVTMSRDESQATSVTSDSGQEDDEKHPDAEYLPTKPIIITPYAPNNTGARKGPGARKQKKSGGSMIMV